MMLNLVTCPSEDSQYYVGMFRNMISIWYRLEQIYDFILVLECILIW